MKAKWKVLFHLFWTFFKIGPATFGGGYAMIPLIEKEIVEKKKWLNSEEITDVFALSQTVPGAVAINSATFVGQRIAGIKGSIAAMIGVSLPTFLIVLTLGILYVFVEDNQTVQSAFQGIGAAIVAIIVYAAIKTAKTAIMDKTTMCMTIAGIIILFFIHPIIAMMISGLAGYFFSHMKRKQKVKVEKGALEDIERC